MASILWRAVVSGVVAAIAAQLVHVAAPGTGGLLAASVVFAGVITTGVVWAASGD